MDTENLKEKLELVLGDSCPAEPITDMFSKLDDEGLEPYDIASSLVLSCCSMMYEEDKQKHHEFMEFMIRVAEKAKSNFEQ